MQVEETLSPPIAYVKEWIFIGLQNVWLLLANNFLVSSPTINDYFQMMHTILGKFSEFKMLSITMPSSSSSPITMFSTGLSFYSTKT